MRKPSLLLVIVTFLCAVAAAVAGLLLITGAFE